MACTKVRVRLIKGFLVALGHAAPDVGGRELRIDRDGRVGYLFEAAEIMRVDGDFGETGLRFETSGVELDRIAEALLGDCHVALGACGAAEPDLDHEAVRIGLGSLLELSERFVDLAVIEQNHAVENGDLGNVGVGLGEFSADGPGLRKVSVQESEGADRRP